MPYVSVVIPAYNAADFIINAYHSIVDQTIDDWEIIFVNDASQDETLSVIQSLMVADKRVKVIDLALNSGAACARNAALAIAEGEWIAILDADDWYSRDRLEVLMRSGELSGADIVLDNLFVVDPISSQTIFLAFETFKNKSITLQFSNFLRNIQSNSIFDFGYLKPLIRRRWLAANNIKYSEELRHGQDVMLLFECYSRGAKVILLSKPYYHYCIQYNPSSRTTSPLTRTQSGHERLLAATQDFFDKHYADLSQEERCLVLSRCKSLQDTMAVVRFRAYLKHSDIVGVVRSLRYPMRTLQRHLFFKKKDLFAAAPHKEARSVLKPTDCAPRRLNALSTFRAFSVRT